jgi:hypothetical protein
LFRVFRGVGEGMHIPGLPATYAAWQTDRSCTSGKTCK